MKVSNLKRGAIASAVAAAVGASVALGGSGFVVDGPMRFNPIPGSAYGQASTTWDVPFVVPAGFKQKLVADETGVDFYPGVDDLTDMNTVNETGKDKGRYLSRTHEVGSNGAVSVVDLKTKVTKVLVQNAGYRRLDGLVWTPWGTLLFAEETTGGRLFEAFFDKKDPTKVVDVKVRPALGIMAHEGIEVFQDGTTFVIDEFANGGIFKFVPDSPKDLSSGQLYAAKGALADGTGALTWVPLNRTAVQQDARAAHNALLAQGLVSKFERPEDVELIDGDVYVAITSTDRVLKFDLAGSKVTNFVKAGVNTPVEDIAGGVTGFNGPDNLADGPDGRLWIVEDNDYSDIWVADGDENGVAKANHLFASLKDIGAEGTGIYFGRDKKTLFVNIQHPDKALADGTWMITRR